MYKRIKCVLLLTLLVALTACETASNTGHLDKLYTAAIEDARIAAPHEISRSLTAISSPANKNTPPHLIWKKIDGEQHVLVCTWAGKFIAGQNWRKGEKHKLSPTTNIWITASPELKYFFRDNGFWPGTHAGRVLRIEQLLGLPRDDGNVRFIEFWVKPNDLFRPSADPDPSDHEAQLEYPWKTNRFQSMAPKQMIHEYVSPEVPDRAYTYAQWFENLNATSYTASPPYPWTRLGYTYDWSDDRHNNGHVGLSEFIVVGGASIVIEQTVETEQMEEYFVRP
ncbi:hypothetical protein [Maridesulfovibrio sp. FT414]|uniref:hypothetical protein n=1 Tax=Maridesulfovibrio sp. FT414 TaxID=2979469 RepID=UPI003D806A77